MVLLRHPVLLMLSSLLILPTLLFVFSQKMRGWRGGEEGEEVNPLYSYTNEEPINWGLIFLILFASMMVYCVFQKHYKFPKTYQQLKSYFQ